MAEGFELGFYYAVAAADEILLLGTAGVGFDDTDLVRLGTRVEPGGGTVLWQEMGEVIPAAHDSYLSASTTADGTTWLMGRTTHTDRTEQWLCSTQL